MDIILRNILEEDKTILIVSYLNEIENNQERAQKFADDLINKHKTIICLQNEKLLGSITWDIHSNLSDGIIELVNLGINLNSSNQGIAKELLLTLINYAKKEFSKKGFKLRVIYCFLERNPEFNHFFYKQMGFREISIVPALYPHDDGVLWIKYF